MEKQHKNNSKDTREEILNLAIMWFQQVREWAMHRKNAIGATMSKTDTLNEIAAFSYSAINYFKAEKEI